MKKQFVVFSFILTLLLQLNFSFSTTAQKLHIGVEAGPTISSIITNSPQNQLYSPRVGATSGIFMEKEFTSFFALRFGTFYTLKGGWQNHGNNSNSVDLFFWNLHYLSIPIMATFTPIKPIRLGIGIEPNINLANNHLFMQVPLFGIGARAEVGWQISKMFRLIGHFTYDLTNILEIYYTDNQGNITNNGNPVPYNNISGGITLACVIKSW